MRDALGYIRVFSEEQADSGPGLEAQRQRIAAYYAMKGLRLCGLSGEEACLRRLVGLHFRASA